MMEVYNPLTDETAFRSEAFDVGAFRKPTELHKASTKSKEMTLKPSVTGNSESMVIDAASWLPMAAEHYHISRDIRDYVLVPVPAVITDVPNTNGDCLRTAEALRFRPDLGMLAYKTWRGKPTHYEHDNKDITKAKGVIFDVYMNALPQFRGNHARIIQLLAFDRTKDPELVRRILAGELNTYSIGMWYQAYTCSLCGHTVRKENLRAVCSHTVVNKPTYEAGGRLVYRDVHMITGFENSAVEDPAFVSNHHNQNQVMDLRGIR
jgi:hypothetical protein